MNALTDIIRAEIQRSGPIPFARFMELALYHPEHGYYETPRPIGRRGDFYTSVSVGPVFGELLAFHFAEILAALPHPTLQLAEAGAHDGRLALDILSHLQQHRPELLPRLQYWILEPSPRRTDTQRATLHAFAEHLRWFADWTQLPHPVTGIIFSNELLDAFPVHRLGWNAAQKQWFEWCVTCDPKHFQWTRTALASNLDPTACLYAMERGLQSASPLPPHTHANPPEQVPPPSAFPLPSTGRGTKGEGWSNPNAPTSPSAGTASPSPWGEGRGEGDRDAANPCAQNATPTTSQIEIQKLLSLLPDDFTTEISPAAVAWWQSAARALRNGCLLAVDYGLTAEQFFTPGRAHGTLRGYYRHHHADDLLARPGEQDLTAHVNFTALQQAGEAVGLTSDDPLQSQAKFLTTIFEATMRQPEQFPPWTSERLRQFQTLINPEHLGRAFSFLVQRTR
ncbi:MAG: SAM-dependent methyltransferase [Verrucomicrobiota bacterium]